MNRLHFTLALSTLAHFKGSAYASSASTQSDSCSLLKGVELAFGVEDPKGLASLLLDHEREACASGSCYKVDIAQDCKGQSVDDVQCQMKVFSTSAKLGTSAICDAGCSDAPCTLACKGIDAGICKGADYVACKAGCLGIKSCVHKCEHKIVGPCVHKLISACDDKCRRSMAKCKDRCTQSLTMHITGDLQSMQGLVSGMSVVGLELNCSGSGILSPLTFNATAEVNVTELHVGVQIKMEDAGISSTDVVNLDNVRTALSIPFNGQAMCGLFKNNMVIDVGTPSITDVNLDVDLKLDSILSSISSAVCAGMPRCSDAIKKLISQRVEQEIRMRLPGAAAGAIGKALAGLARKATCPKIVGGSEEFV